MSRQRPREDVTTMRKAVDRYRRQDHEEWVDASEEVDRLQVEAARGAGSSVLGYPRKPRR